MTREDPHSLVHAVERIGDRWTLLVVDALLGGPRRFGELSELVGGIAPNVLTARLRQLEADGVVRSAPYSQRPRRYAYELTDAGRELAGALALLAAWGRRQRGAGHGPGEPVHRTCGSALEARLWCPTCDRQVDDPEADELEHL
ncbi:MAG TPA: helix-turn-helix domain-containing protein [Microthrixaceae bacterium]|nr:helix-turn-helix domain-containing protein [Microthrixaceae bacterium]